MAEKIKFEKFVRTSFIHNPMMNNELDAQALQIRKDPLTGVQSVFNPRLEDKVAMFYGKSDTALIAKMAEESRSRCFLCGDLWKQITPKYPADLVPEGRIVRGQAVLFPNIFPAAPVHAVIRVGETHYVPLSEFDAQAVADAISVSLELTRRLSEKDASLTCMAINGNYLGPAGASISHPHFQTVGGDLPFTYVGDVQTLGRAYFEKNRTSYWADLANVEKASGERYIASIGPVEWITSFSPAGANEVVGILPDRRDFLEMDDADAAGLAKGLTAVLAGYADMGLSTFNFAIYSGPLDIKDDSFRCFIRIISRQNVYENYRTDDYFLQKMLRNELILTPPEVLAKNLKARF